MIRVEIELSTIPSTVEKVHALLSPFMLAVKEDGAVIHRFTIEETDA